MSKNGMKLVSGSVGGVKTTFGNAAMTSVDDKAANASVLNGADIRGGEKGTKSKLSGVTFAKIPSGPAPNEHVSIKTGVIATSANYHNPKMK